MGQVQEKGSDDGSISNLLSQNQYDLATNGREFLLREADQNDFFLLGELHGDNEIPTLLRALWPEMWKQGYHHIAAEVSPWAAEQLELSSAEKNREVLGLWTKQEAIGVRAFARPNVSVIWGCDMEEIQPQFPIRELAVLNPGDANLQRMAELVDKGYKRELAPELYELIKKSAGKADRIANGISLRENTLRTLEIERNRLRSDTKMVAQKERELLMKEQLLEHLRSDPESKTVSKVFLRFGRNHMHRGYDARGISTLGNFVAEFAVAEGKSAFNIGAFGAGGKASLRGDTWDADERQDEPAFAFLAKEVKYPATVFDLRALRALLHRIPQEKRSVLQTNLIYWTDSYDALICYKVVTLFSRRREHLWNSFRKSSKHLRVGLVSELRLD
ncbi:MAG TPA: hypothetical protein VN025_10230 [Candidatus Dormibacteraeota bacterium]|nr:hypothetical protein [Candidatus Dormibacteraeota bacterium]